jgi:hypothetical protein
MCRALVYAALQPRRRPGQRLLLPWMEGNAGSLIVIVVQRPELLVASTLFRAVYQEMQLHAGSSTTPRGVPPTSCDHFGPWTRRAMARDGCFSTRYTICVSRNREKRLTMSILTMYFCGKQLRRYRYGGLGVISLVNLLFCLVWSGSGLDSGILWYTVASKMTTCPKAGIPDVHAPTAHRRPPGRYCSHQPYPAPSANATSFRR